MSSLSQLKGTQRLSWPCRLDLPSTSHLRLRTRGLSLMPAALSTQNSLDQPSASRRSLVNLGVDTGRGPSGRRPCRALNPELDRCHSPLTVAAPAYTYPARLTSASVPTSLSSSSSRHPKFYAFGHLRDRAASPFIARTLGSYGTISPNRSFATSSPAMVANKIDGTAIAKQIRESIASDILEKQKLNPRFQPQLTIIQVGDRSDSSTYVRMKQKAAKEANVDCELIQFPESISEPELLDRIYRLNDDPTVHGILVQLPIPKHLDEYVITSAVADEKDVDGFGTRNIGELAKKGGRPFFIPCTPKGVMVLLQEAGVDLKGKNAVVLGRSDIVGSPVSYLLRNADATVTVCHSKTEGLKEHLKAADVVIAAIGQPGFVQGDWLKPGVVVIDVGTNYIPDASKKSGQRLVGDVDYESASQVASHITPVPGGVGPMTVAMLLSNVVDSTVKSFERQKQRKISPLPLHLKEPVPSDIEVSRSQNPKQITRLAKEVGIASHELEPYGAYKAKVDLSLLKRLDHRRNGKYVVVTGITPTPLGEGKSTTTMGIAQALGAHLGRVTFANVRQPSQGPTFGIKGGAAGGGYSQVIPMDEFNLHLTGDIHAITAANNLLAAAIETRMFHENTQKDGPLYKRLVPAKNGKRVFAPVMAPRLKKLGIEKTNPDDLTEEEIRRFARLDIDPETITWRRVLDVNDRHLRGITVGAAPTEKGHTRETGFDISVASECMAILALSTDLADMRRRLGSMVVASSRSGDPVTCDDIGAGGALTALMRDAIKPNLMQTLEGTPVFVHAGPFANISVGNSSILADKMALKIVGTEPDEDHAEKAGFVVTEAGFDFTMGGERFFNIKCRASGLVPDVVVVVATVRALKVHGGGPPIAPGAPLNAVYKQENVDILRAGCVNLKKHIENAKSYGIPVVVAINKFVTDTDAEIAVIREEAIAAGAEDAILSNHWAEGGKGAIELGKGVIAASEKPKDFKLLYDLEGSVQERIEAIGKKMYGAAAVEFSELAQKKVDTYTKQGFGNLPICVAKTQYSLSHDPDLKGAPTGFTVPIRDVRMAAGAGYLYALAADIQTIPGLPTAPGYLNVDVDTETGEIDGLF
ncbi:Putative formate-tetrahydrofolate ligase, FTHFS, tetrahydrofolate dehydrogenase/cyclohydrolase [Colletotrichum destructivum]|uniref:C-1-tetrahydrofolate synthase, cytoplasmic n=2 Tax=Colletotrichum destructivum species complex TaxID=2707350 RepID=A0AAX4J0L1_9PEZI|nr:Putative formate-tetrahydrofolate ligase, FTHFS, tetrahydrofolate dehydrogenase/cyclohydrolase [Colletotrichum destructivum]